MIGAFLLQPHVTRMVVGQFNDQHALVFRQRCRNLLDQLLLSLNIDWRKQFVLMNGLKEVLVLRLTLFFGIGERRHVPKVPFILQLRGTNRRQFEQFF